MTRFVAAFILQRLEHTPATICSSPRPNSVVNISRNPINAHFQSVVEMEPTR